MDERTSVSTFDDFLKQTTKIVTLPVSGLSVKIKKINLGKMVSSGVIPTEIMSAADSSKKPKGIVRQNLDENAAKLLDAEIAKYEKDINKKDVDLKSFDLIKAILQNLYAEKDKSRLKVLAAAYKTSAIFLEGGMVSPRFSIEPKEGFLSFEHLEEDDKAFLVNQISSLSSISGGGAKKLESFREEPTKPSNA